MSIGNTDFPAVLFKVTTREALKTFLNSFSSNENYRRDIVLFLRRFYKVQKKKEKC